ncbi:MAG: DUF1990 family protein [Thermoleophilaceae bacterium]|nr:DUF1990 family protein [Thermoleophilaceae bacterium]
MAGFAMVRNVLSDRRKAAHALDDLSRRRLNYDVPPSEGFAVGSGWHIDDYRQPLPSEQPGPPAADGPWAAARGLLRDYEFIDPSIVRALFRSDGPLEGRNMLLELRFWGLRFHVGVRVAEVLEGTRTEDGREVAVWGWAYRTLEGHIEAGQMDYEVRKWLDTGEVEFRIHAFSRAADIANPVVRLGFRLFGRRQQKRFASTACERMRGLVEADLAAREHPPASAGGDEIRARGPGLRQSLGLVVRPTSAGGRLGA